jgi:hypothetical protein
MDRLAPYRELNWPLPPIWAVDGQTLPYRLGKGCRFHTPFRIVRTQYGHTQSTNVRLMAVFGRQTFLLGTYRTINPPASAVTIRTVSPIPNDPDFVLRYPNR